MIASIVFRDYCSMQHPTFKRRRKTRSTYLFIMVLLILLGTCFSASNNYGERNKGQQRHAQNQDNNINYNNKAEQMLFSFFDKLHSLEEKYGSNLVTVQNAADLYPILSQTSTAATAAASSGDCPNYHHYSSSSDNHFKMQPGKKGSCYTPIITIH